MADQILNVTIKGIGDFSDVVSNVNSVQKALTKLKLPDKLGDNLNKNISNFTKEYDKYQKKLSEGIKTQGDSNAISKSLNSMLNSYEKIVKDFGKIPTKDFKDIFKLDDSAFASVQRRLKDIEASIKKIKLDPKQLTDPLKVFQNATKAKSLFGNGKGFDRLTEAFKTNDLEQAKQAIVEIDNYLARFGSRMDADKFKALSKAFEPVKRHVLDSDTATQKFAKDVDSLNAELAEIGGNGIKELNGLQQGLERTDEAAKKVTNQLKQQHEQEFSFTKQVQDIDRQIQSYFGLSQMIRKVGDIARDAFNTVKELDAAMTETAVVTNFSVSDMWNMLPTYTEQANKLGATIKDVYEAATLYYQQGLNTNQAMGLANETLKMARIAGMDAAEATDMMTSALRGFNMEINQTSAQKVNDIYSQLAAVTASDTRELGTAMEKTASLASSANMDIETTSAFLAQMIETTREAPENLGTAMKTIIARFQEMKKDPTSLVDSEGVAMDVNKVDTALKSIGVALTNSKGEFRDLDDVFLDISKRWDSLSQGQQRYIATTAAGSRQQSRFIAMMSNYDRTMELVNEANNSAGASQKQFEKTMDSMSSKLNQLKNAWDKFTMGLMNNQILKTGVDGLTQFFTVINKIIDVLSNLGGKINDPFGGIAKSALTLMATLGGLNFGKKIAGGSIAAGVGWWTNEGKFTDNFMKGYGIPKRSKPEDIRDKKIERLREKQQEKRQIKQQVPVDITTYLRRIDTSDVDPRLAAAIEEEVGDGPDIPVNARVKINNIVDVNGLDEDLKLPIAKDKEGKPLPDVSDKTRKQGEAAIKTANNFSSLGDSIADAGEALQLFGDKLGPLGGIFSTIGTAMVSFGTTISSVSAAASAAMAEGVAAGAAWKSAILSTIGPMLAVGAVVGLIAGTIYLVDKAIETDKEKIERLTNSANAASDAYDSLKQESSELKDSLESIQSNEDSFEGLVAGTTEFNDKLTETNQKIDELIQKYPELNKYLSVDKNGLKHISQEGIDFIQKQQDKLVGNASAQNILQNARLKAEQDRQKIKQNEKEIHGIEYTRVADEGGGYDIKKSSLTTEEQKRIDQLKQESKYLKENLENSEKMATQQALAASFTNIEAGDRDRMASMYVDSYEAAKKRAEVEKDEGKMLKTYADYYGYQYDAASKKVLDSSGQEIEIDKEALKGVYSDIVATIDIQASAESLDKIEDDVNQKFAEGLNLGASRGDNILSGVLTGDIESDPELVKKLAKKTPQQIENTLKKLSDAELAALMGVKETDLKEHGEELIEKFAGTIKESTNNTLEAQSQVYKDLGAKMAMAQGKTQYDFTGVPDRFARDLRKTYENDTKAIADEIKQLTVEQANILNNVGDKLNENVGLNAMSTFFDKSIPIYKKNNEALTKEFNNILSGTNWESAASRLETYNKAINSSKSEIKDWGKEMRNSTDEANLLGKAFDEFLGGDWTELIEKADDFKNAVGEFDGAGILKASEQSGTLKTLLDSGEVSASGLAMALEAIDDGALFSVNETTLKLLSSLNRVTDAALEAHNVIQNFDPGIDYGESEDFMIENAKKVKEYMDNNEWGNEQLQNYIKMAAGQDRWNNTLRDYKGDLEATTKALQHYATDFSEGTGKVWDSFVKEQGLNGKSFDENLSKIEDEDLKERFKKANVDMSWGEDGFLRIDFGDLTTQEFEQYLQQVGGLSEDYSKFMLENLANYDATIRQKLSANDLYNTVQNDKDFQDAHKDADEKIHLAGSDIIAYQEAGGDLEKLAKAAGYETVAELWNNDFKTTENREEITDYNKLLNNFSETFYGSFDKLLNNKTFLDTNGNFDIAKLMSDSLLKGESETQAMGTAYEAYKRLTADSKEDAYINGQRIESGLSPEEFAERMQEISNPSEWVEVGETIGQQIVSAFQAADLFGKLQEGTPIKEAAFTRNETGEGQLNQDNFSKVVDKIALATDDDKERQQSIAEYLGQSKQLFESMGTEEQAQALQGIVDKLGELKFSPEEISNTISQGLGVVLQTGTGGSIQTDNKGKITFDSAQAIKELDLQLKEHNFTAQVKGQFVGFGGAQNSSGSSVSVGTMARGSRGGYTISGRPTLTGEEGEELVWEPKQNKAYMVGSNGPQFANISKNAVVWNADQTKRIKKNSGSVGRVGTGARGIIPIGTMAEGTRVPGSFFADVTGNFLDFKQPEQKPEVPVTGKLEFEGQENKGLLGKIFGGKDNGPTVNVTAEANILKVKDEAKVVKDVNAEAIVKKVDKKGLVSGEPVEISGVVKKITTDKKETKKPEQKTITTTTKYETKTDGKAQKDVDNVKSNKTVIIKTKASPDAQNAINKIKGKSIDIHINPKFDGTWEKTATVKVHTEKAAHGKNNHIQYHSAPSFGSAAKGRYGTVGPKDKGGLTLTGERGYEIAWLPSENRSMILGVGGPQMITLPEDAVVYTHEQSKDIIKRKGIPAGSQDKGKAGIKRPDSSGGSSNSSNSNSGGTNKTNNDKKKKSSKKDNKKDDKKEKANTSAISKIIVWWDNITRRADATQRKADKNQKTYEKYLKDIKATLKDTGTIGGGNDFISNTNKAINLYNDQLKQAAFELRNLTIGTEGQRNAAKTKTKKDDKKANKRAFLNESGGAVKISYNKKSGKKKKSVNQIIDTAKYIKEQDGTYIIDQSQLNKIKNSEKRKALADALNKEINDRISKKNAAEDNIEKANEALEKFSEELYNTFFAWENELTKIWNITQKIEQAQSRMSMNDAYDELLKAQLSTGKLTAGAESRNKDLTNFRSRLESQNDLLKERQKAITESQNNLRRILNSEDEKQTLTKVNDKLNATQKLNELNNAKQAKQAYDNAIVSRKTTQDNISKIQAKIIKLKDKKNLSKADKQEIEKLRKQRDNLKKQKENYDKIIKDNKALAGKVNQLQQEYNNVSSNALNETQKRGYEQYQKELTDQITAQDMARKYIDVTKRANGTIDIQFNTEAFEDARLNGNITNDMAKAVQDWVKKLQEATANLQQNYEDLTKEVTEYYTQLESLQDEWADYGKELTEIVESYEKEQIDKIKQLSDEIKKTLDKLLNDVKRNLDERRKQEENAKTERDISQKQQRLAALRADTSGGHQVEIAQLEKEIAEDQQNYRNSLEDQLLDRLQQQADLAAEQRERQIELQEMLVDSVNNIQQVNEWMNRAKGLSEIKDEEERNAAIEELKKEVREGYYSKNNFNNVTEAEQGKIKTDFEQFFNGLITNQQKQKELTNAINDLTDVLKTLDKLIKEQTLTLSNAKERGYGIKNAQEKFGASLSELRTEGNYTFEDFKDANYSYRQIHDAGFTAEDFKKRNISYADAKGAGYNLDQLMSGGYEEAAREKEAQDRAKMQAEEQARINAMKAEEARVAASRAYDAALDRAASNKKTSANELKSVFEYGKKIGYSNAKVAQDLARTALTWEQIAKAAKAAGFGRSTVASWSSSKQNKNATTAAKWKSYATGGLANFTGPAWLDGTPSKPELVLNATDTRNFIALRDVLSKAMSSNDSAENSYANTEFNININIEKVADDYDVDKIITKVKKEITKSAGYRNVTQVRSFR